MYKWVSLFDERNNCLICFTNSFDPTKMGLIVPQPGILSSQATMYIYTLNDNLHGRCALSTGKYVCLPLCIQTTKTKCTTNNTGMTLLYSVYVR